MTMKSSAIIKHPYLSFCWLLFILLAIAVSLETPQLFFIDRDTLNYFSRFITPPGLLSLELSLFQEARL